MKVEGSKPLPNHARRSVGKASPAGSGRFAQALGGADGAGQPSGLSGAAPIGGLDALLSLQGVDDSTERERKARGRAAEILDQLDELRADMLMGEIPAMRLRQIATLVSRARAAVDDPSLTALLDDVDLRAQVELAKLGIDSAFSGG